MLELKDLLEDYRWYLQKEIQSHNNEIGNVKRAIVGGYAWTTTEGREQQEIEYLQERLDMVNKILTNSPTPR